MILPIRAEPEVNDNVISKPTLILCKFLNGPFSELKGDRILESS